MKNSLEEKFLLSEKKIFSENKISEIEIWENDFYLEIWDKNSLDFKNKKIFLTEDFIENFWWDKDFSAKIFYFNKISQVISNWNLIDSKFFLSAFFKKEEKKVLDSRLRGNDRGKDENDRGVENKFWNVNNPSDYSIYLQVFFLSIFNDQNISFEVQDLLEKKLKIWEKNIKISDFLKLFVEQFSQFDLQGNFEKKILWKEVNSDLQKKLSAFKFILNDNWIYEILEKLERERQKKNNLKQEKSQEKKEKQEKKMEEEIEQILPPDFNEKYDPKDSIKEENESWWIQVIWSFDPPITWYFKQYSMHHFWNDLKWETDTSDLKKVEWKSWNENLEIETIFSTKINPGLNPISCPYWFKVLDFDWWENEILKNPDWDFFINSKKWWDVKISFVKISWKKTNIIIPENAGIQNYSLNLENFWPETKIWKFISEKISEGKNNFEILSEIKEKILNKYYSTEYQWSFLEKSSSKKDYFDNLFSWEKMECYSANTLFVAISRELWFEAKLSVWFNSNLKKWWKSYISVNDWHAWAEIKINWKWQIEDVTPVNSDNDNDEKNKEEDDEKNKDDEKKYKNNSDELDDFDPKDLEDLKNEILKKSWEISDELVEMFDEWFDLKILKDFEKILWTVEDDAKKLTKNIKEILKIKTLERERKKVETIQKTAKINTKKVLKDFPEIWLWMSSDLWKNAMQKVLDWKYYLKNKFKEKEVVDFPDEIRFSFALDLSWSMDYERKERLNNYLVLFREAFSLLYREFKNKKVDLKLDVYVFWSNTEKIISDLTLNKDKKSKSQIIQAFDFVKKNNLLWNDEEKLYSKIISEKEILKKENEKRPKNRQKKSVNVWITITDEETSTPDQITNLLWVLDKKYETAFVAVNVWWWRALEMMSWYSYWINDWEDSVQNYSDLLWEILKERV